jgi:N-acetyl-1-D-myo-inositol-2-amino-2-deoxy-alpha-D-glucopyranoside deacetylase
MSDDAGGLLLVHAHPDDECFGTGGLIARSVAEGRRVDLVTCTGGEEGEIHDPTLDQDEARPRLREIREVELRCSLAALNGSGPGELELHLLGFRDSGMMGTESNERDDVFWHADLDKAAGKVVAIIRAARPSVMVTYDANGNYGHPDHINAHRVAIAAWEAAADPARFPEAGPPHAIAKLYEIVFSRDRWTALTTEMEARGIKLPWGDTEEAQTGEETEAAAGGEPGKAGEAAAETAAEEEPFGVAEADITTAVDVADVAAAKLAAMDCHKTQRQDMGWVLDMPQDLQAKAISPEFFMLTRWRDHEIPAGGRESSVFDGL